MLIWGVLLTVAGVALGAAQTWARWFSIVVVSLNVFAQLGFLGNSQYSLWALTALTLNVVVLYALTVRWSESKTDLAPSRMSLVLRLIGLGIALLICGYVAIFVFGALWAQIGFGVAMAVVVGGLLFFTWRQDKKAREARAGLDRI